MKLTLEDLPFEILTHILFIGYKNDYYGFEKTFFVLRKTSKTLKEATDDFLLSGSSKPIAYLKLIKLRSLLQNELNFPYYPSKNIANINEEIYRDFSSLYCSVIRYDENFWKIFNKQTISAIEILFVKPIFHLTSCFSSYKVPLLSLLAYWRNLDFVANLPEKLPCSLDYQKILAWDNYDAFYRACVTNNIAMVKLLFEQCNPETRQKMFRGPKQNPYIVFASTAREWSVDVLKLLIDLCKPSNQQKMLRADGYIAFSCACKNGNEKLIDLFLKICEPKNHLKMLSTSNHTPLRWAIKNGQLNTVKKIFFLYPAEIKQSVLEKIRGSVRHTSSTEVLHFLIEQWNNPNVAPFFSQAFNSILVAAARDESLLDKIIEKSPNNILQEAIRYNTYGIFRFYCLKGKSTLVKKIFYISNPNYSYISSHYSTLTRQLALIESFGYTSFFNACESGSYDTIQTIFELCDINKKQEMIASYYYEGFRIVCYRENLIAAALIFSQANEANLKELIKIAQSPFPKRNWNQQPIRDKIINTDLNFLFFYRDFMQSIEDNKKIKITKEARNYIFGRSAFFQNISIPDKTNTDPYHNWALVKNN